MANINISTQQLIDEIRLMSNLKNNQYFSDDDIVQFINDAKDELFDHVVDANQHYFIKTFDFTLSGGVLTNPLPTDFYKQNFLEINPDTTTRQAVPMLSNYLQRDQGYNALGVYLGPGPDRRYQIEDDHITILGSAPNNTDGAYRLYYTPLLPDMALPFVVDLSVNPDVVVAAATNAPLDGAGLTWTVFPSILELSCADTVPPLRIDGYIPLNGDYLFFDKNDSPTSSLTMGLYQYVGVNDSAGVLTYQFNRLTAYDNAMTVPAGLKIGVTNGIHYANTTLVTQEIWRVNSNAVDVQGANSIIHPDFNPYSINFANPTFILDNVPAAVPDNMPFGGAQITLRGNNVGDTFPGFPLLIDTVNNAYSAVLQSVPTPVVGPINSNALVTITWTQLSYTLPLQMVPWALYIKVHSARTIRAARQQDTAQLDVQLASLRQRAIKMSANRTEDVTQAPYLRRRGGNWGTDGNQF